MKINPTFPHVSKLGSALPKFVTYLVIGLSVPVGSFQSAVASHSPTLASPPPLDTAARSQLGRIAVVPGSNPVEMQFSKPDGRRFDAGEAAIEGAGGVGQLGANVMEFGAKFAGKTPVLHPGHAIALGSLALGTVINELAPIGAVLGSNGSSANTLSPEEVSELENNLAHVMRTGAVHSRLCDSFFAAARERTGRALARRDGLNSAEKETTAAFAREGISTVLEIALERVDLRRFTKSDASFALVVKARARLIQTRNQTVLSDLPFEYRSGSGLFLDWTLDHAEPFQRALETANRRLAAEMVRVLFLETAPSIALERANHRSSPDLGKEWALERGNGNAGNPRAALLPMRTTTHSGKKQPLTPQVADRETRRSRANAPKITFVEQPPLSAEILANLGRVGIISTSTLPAIALQRPLTKSRAMLEACDDAQQILNDFGSPFAFLVNGPMNIVRNRQPIACAGPTVLGPIAGGVVGAGAALVSTPVGVGVGLGGQAYGAVNGLSDQTFRNADDTVTRMVHEANPQDSLRKEVLKQARQLTTHPIELVKKPFPPGAEEMFSQMACVMAGTLAWVPDGQTPAHYLASQKVDTALEIQLLHPALNGKGVVNSPMALSVDVRASLIRVRDSEPLYSCAMLYRGPGRKFTQWAANGAAPLREELERCYQTVAATIVEQLAVHAWPRELPIELAGIKH